MAMTFVHKYFSSCSISETEEFFCNSYHLVCHETGCVVKEDGEKICRVFLGGDYVEWAWKRNDVQSQRYHRYGT